MMEVAKEASYVGVRKPLLIDGITGLPDNPALADVVNSFYAGNPVS
jgi:hypothetical protein